MCRIPIGVDPPEKKSGVGWKAFSRNKHRDLRGEFYDLRGVWSGVGPAGRGPAYRVGVVYRAVGPGFHVYLDRRDADRLAKECRLVTRKVHYTGAKTSGLDTPHDLGKTILVDHMTILRVKK